MTKKMNLFFLLLASMLTVATFTACGDDDEDDNKKPETVESSGSNTTEDVVTGEAVDVASTGATLYGYINNEVDKYSEFGIVYGTESDAARLARSGVKVKADGFDAGTNNRRFSVSPTGLKESTTYYYYAYAGQKSANKVLSFTTRSICPDANHPHWIDLGLPSGTKWRCCNEGASAPEEYGGYYTFGQVSTAPKQDQIAELCVQCNYTWTTKNDVKGVQFTGPNGETIFLPAAGIRRGNGLENVGWGYYWSSTYFSGDYPPQLFFSDSYAEWDDTYSYRGNGLSVRPVHKN